MSNMAAEGNEQRSIRSMVMALCHPLPFSISLVSFLQLCVPAWKHSETRLHVSQIACPQWISLYDMDHISTSFGREGICCLSSLSQHRMHPPGAGSLGINDNIPGL